MMKSAAMSNAYDRRLANSVYSEVSGVCAVRPRPIWRPANKENICVKHVLMHSNVTGIIQCRTARIELHGTVKQKHC